MKYSTISLKKSRVKTIKLSLLPVGKTRENMTNNLVLENAQMFQEKKYILQEKLDLIYKNLSEKILSDLQLPVETWREYFNAINNKNNETKRTVGDTLKTLISTALQNAYDDLLKDCKNNSQYNNYIITKILPTLYKDDEEVNNLIHLFTGRTGYFDNYFTVRERLLTNTDFGTIAYRIVDENAPIYFNNIHKIDKELSILDGSVSVVNFTLVDYINYTLSQTEITKYNDFVASYNSYINEYNQKNKTNYPLLDILYKQILSDTESKFVVEKYTVDTELLNDVAMNLNNWMNSIYNIKNAFENQLKDSYIIDKRNLPGLSIYTYNDKDVLTSYNYIDWRRNQDQTTKNDKIYKSEFDKGLSLKTLFTFGNEYSEKSASIENINNKINSLVAVITKNKANLVNSLSNHEGSLKEDKELKKNLSSLLDSITTFKNYVVLFHNDLNNYNAFNTTLDEELAGEIKNCNLSLNKCRNYATSKDDYSDKIKIDLNNPSILKGWDINKEKDYKNSILRKDNKYYLFAFSDTRTYNKMKDNYTEGEYYEKLNFKSIPSVRRYLFKNIPPSGLCSTEILDLMEKEKNKEITPEETEKLISFVINEFLPNYKCLQDSNGNTYFTFNFKNPFEYSSFNDFCNDMETQNYQIWITKMSVEDVNNMVEEGSAYLFEMYNMDMSEHSKGKESIHTKLFLNAFTHPETIQILGGGEIFYREPKNLTNAVVHHKGDILANKNPDNEYKTTTLKYDIIKDRRFTQEHFEVHIPLCINWREDNKFYNNSFKETLINTIKEDINSNTDYYIMGIDRGERNLVYYNVINQKGEIQEQGHFNIIENFNYVKKLDELKKANDEARKNWGNVTDIANVKESYLGLVVNKILKIAMKYNAVIAIEQLSTINNKNIEKQVYQKFIDSLVSKFNQLCDKDLDETSEGGVLNPYTLCNNELTNGIGQNGILFFINPAHTSVTDPTTGFVPNSRIVKFPNMKLARERIMAFDNIIYNKEEDYFEFYLNYSKFKSIMGSDLNMNDNYTWVVCSNGLRECNLGGEFKNKTIDITEEWKKLFNDYNINYTSKNLQDYIYSVGEKNFFNRFSTLAILTMQTRNTNNEKNLDYILSPVKNSKGTFFTTKGKENIINAISNGDSNGAYNIAKKGIREIERQLKNEKEVIDWCKWARENVLA